MRRWVTTGATAFLLACAALAGCGGGARDDAAHRSTARNEPSPSSSRSSTAGSSAQPAHAADGLDPVRSGCARDGENIPRTGVQLRRADGRPFAVVLLRRSRGCGSAWGVALGVPAAQGLTLTLETVRRPGHTVRGVVSTGPFPRAGVLGEELLDRHGCVLARATVRRAGAVLGRAQTPCG
ncbi:MAG TPA: hypothetical protein VFW29_08385 [Solirubrobacteraceae bacterium]|nr:hypothetical protein [Solirubrobacteraceae bacterium]